MFREELVCANEIMFVVMDMGAGHFIAVLPVPHYMLYMFADWNGFGELFKRSKTLGSLFRQSS